jgi:hypothetical protein
MPSDLFEAAQPLLARLAAVLDRDPVLRRELAGFARALADWIDAPPPAEPPSPVAPAPAEEPPPLPPLLPTPPTRPAEPPLLTAVADEERDIDLIALPVLADRCRVKADASRLVARRMAGEPVHVLEEDAVLRQADALPNCFLWMLTSSPPTSAPRVWTDLAGAFDTAAAAADLLAAWVQTPEAIVSRSAAEVLALAAEAQSILYYAVADARTVRMDFEQVQLYVRVVEETRRLEVYVPRYLKREHRADPASWPDLSRRLAAVTGRLREVGGQDRTRRKAMQNLQHKLTRLRGQPETHADEWPRILELIDQVIEAGLPPSNVQLRELLLPVLEQVPEDAELPATVRLVLREIDRYLAEEAPDDDPTQPELPTPEVAEVARLLAGREAVLIGGQVRPDRRKALIRAFGLADLNWITTPEHTSVTVFEAPIARPEVGLVLLATRWSNHDYQNVKDFCDRYGKMFVKLPAGYHPNQVAHQVLAQAGDRLRSAVPTG